MENNRAIHEFDEFAHEYHESLMDPVRAFFASGTDYFHRRKFELLQKLLHVRGLSSANLNWIDVGCGQGDLLKLGAGKFQSLAGCDVSSGMLARCNGLDVRLQVEIHRLPFRSATADIITAVCVFHHVKPADRLPLVKDVVRVLKPGGRLIVMEHNPINPATQWIVSRSPVDGNALLLSRREVGTLMQQADLETDGHEYFLYLPERLYHRLATIEGFLGKLPLGGQYVAIGRKPFSQRS
jgi:ubiquinone/menaquinone biosynthesis C-methylase UbiE